MIHICGSHTLHQAILAQDRDCSSASIFSKSTVMIMCVKWTYNLIQERVFHQSIIEGKAVVCDFTASWVRNNFLGTEGMPAPYEIRPCSNAPAIFSHYTSQASNCSSAAVVGIDAKPVLKCDKMWDITQSWSSYSWATRYFWYIWLPNKTGKLECFSQFYQRSFPMWNPSIAPAYIGVRKYCVTG